jgi:hypothetical protein
MSEKNTAIANIGDLAEPITAFINRVSDAIGVLYEPTHTVKMAKAEAKADRIRATSKLELSHELSPLEKNATASSSFGNESSRKHRVHCGSSY